MMCCSPRAELRASATLDGAEDTEEPTSDAIESKTTVSPLPHLMTSVKGFGDSEGV